MSSCYKREGSTDLSLIKVRISTPDGDLEGRIRQGSDLDSAFRIVTDEGSFIVNGWMLAIEDIEFLD